ncbi:MAG: hypothetical protein HYY18_21955 [Planctomycetes bacterium]|nr:hypothetical protein [Planctomycetota bacterium]
MSKALTALSLLVAVAASAGVVFSSVQLRQANDQLEKLEARLAGLEKTVAVPPAAAPDPSRKDAEGGTDAPASVARLETLGDAIREVRRLRDEMDTVNERASAPPADGQPPDGARESAPPEEEAMRKVVEDVLAAKEKERQEAEKKRAADWAKARTDRAVADLTERLQLSAQQKDHVAQLLTAASAQQMEIWSTRKEGENPWQKVQELRKETDVQVKQVLTAEQQVKYDEYMKQYWGPPRMVQTGDGGGGSFGPGTVQPR